MTREQLAAAVLLEHRIAELYRQRRAIEYADRMTIGFPERDNFLGEWVTYGGDNLFVVLESVKRYMLGMIDISIKSLEEKRKQL